MKNLFLIALVVLGFPAAPSYAQLARSAGSTEARQSIQQVIDEQPQFPGGIQAFGEYIGSNLRYPKQALKAGKSARIFAKFRLDDRGKVQEVMILNPAGYGFDEEVTRVLKQCPRWVPAKSKGRPVESWFQIPVTFNPPAKA